MRNTGGGGAAFGAVASAPRAAGYRGEEGCHLIKGYGRSVPFFQIIILFFTCHRVGGGGISGRGHIGRGRRRGGGKAG